MAKTRHGIRIKEVCKLKGITQKKLSQEMGVSYSNLNERMRLNPTLKWLERVATILEVDVKELL